MSAPILRWSDAMQPRAHSEISVIGTNGKSRLDPERSAHAYPHELSGGMAQPVAIAMAMIAGPKMILADDATLGLGAVIITHDLNSVRSLAHYVAVMRYGKIVESSETETFFARPARDYTKTLLAAELPIEQSEVQRHRAPARHVG